MKLHSDERGELNILLIPVILLSLLFIGAAVFAVWAYGGRQDYKNNVSDKVATAVASNTKAIQAADATKYAEAAKEPLKTYVGPEAYGSAHISFPKTWSAYVVTATNGTNPIDAYFAPDVVPSVTDLASSFALRVQMTSQSYTQVISQFAQQVAKKTATINPYSLPKVPSVVGVRVDGQISQTKQGSMIILPVRDKTLKIWTESNTFSNDFNNNILANLTFSP